jgi:hypothetical protein
MASKQYFHDLDLLKIGQLVNFRVHNVTQGEADALLATLTVENTGLTVYNTSTKQLEVFDGVVFVPQAANIAGDLIFKGPVDAAIPLDTQVEPVVGYQYVVVSPGTLTLDGVSFNVADVTPGDVFFFVTSTDAFVIQRNDNNATELVDGNVRLATSAEVLEGGNATKAVTPATLHNKLRTGLYTRMYYEIVNLEAGVPLQINHFLNLLSKDAFTINAMLDGSQISLDVDSVSNNSLTLLAHTPANGVTVTVSGATLS